MGPTRVIVQDPCPVGLPEILTIAHVVLRIAAWSQSKTPKSNDLPNTSAGGTVPPQPHEGRRGRKRD